jgi:hypothetical protein
MYFCRVNAERSNDAICEADLCDNDDECDDHDPCTEDACWNHSEGVNYCGHQPHCLDHACVAEDGKPVCRNDQYCTGWWDCDDHDPCTSDYCLPWTGFCYFVRKSCGPKGTCVVEVGQAVCDFDE